MVTFVALYRVRVGNGQHFLPLVSDQRHLLAGPDAFLGAGGMLLVHALGAAFCIAYPAFHRFGLAGACGQRHVKEHHRYGSTHQQKFLHSFFSSLYAVLAARRGTHVELCRWAQPSRRLCRVWTPVPGYSRSSEGGTAAGSTISQGGFLLAGRE